MPKIRQRVGSITNLDMYQVFNTSKVLYYKDNTETNVFTDEASFYIAVEFPQDSTGHVIIHVFSNGDEIITLKSVRAASEMTYYAYPDGIQKTFDNTLYHSAEKKAFRKDLDIVNNGEYRAIQYIMYYHMVGNEIDFLGIDIQGFDTESNLTCNKVYHFFNTPGTLPKVTTDNENVLNLYKIAQSGDKNSLFEIGHYYYKLFDLDDDRDYNMISAIYWWEQAAFKGHHLAIIYLTALYAGGEGLFSYGEGKKFRNDTMYVKFADMGSEEGLLYCQFCLGNIAREGLSELGKDMGFAIKCWKAVIDTDIEYVKQTERNRSLISNYRSILRAYHNLAITYAHGYGVTPNVNKAIEYWKKAATYGSSTAAAALIEVYDEGKLVQRDTKEAEYWLNVMRSNNY